MASRVLTALMVLAAALVAPASVAYAQCGPPSSLEQTLAQAEVVFVGRVVDRANRDRTAVMEVLEIWKGRSLSARVTVKGGPDELEQQTAIDRTYLLGQIYLVIPAGDAEPFRDSLCTGTQLWSTPTGSIPEHLQPAVGNDALLPILGGGGTGAGTGVSTGGSVSLDDLRVVLVVVAAAGLVLLGFWRLSRLGSRRKKAGRRKGAEAAAASPVAVVKTRKRRLPRVAMPAALDKRRGSRLEQARRAARKARKGSSAHDKEQLERVVKLTATLPPSRRNHYTSGRRSAP